jgi:hypothetical protein
MNVKRFLAVGLAATMVLGNGVTAFAGDNDGVNGAGVVEYDDSTAVVYDSVTVPTLTGSKYNFEVDPTGLLHEYDADQYVAGSVYFSSVSTHEALVPNAENLDGDKLYTASKEAYAAVDGKWSGIVKTANVDDSTGAITVTAVNGNFFVWAPAADADKDTHYTNGKNGVWTEIKADNYSNWFEVSKSGDDYLLSLKNDYKAGTYVCDGKIYTITYTEIPAAGIVEAAGSAVDVGDYATISNNAVTAYTNVYTFTAGTDGNPDTYTILAADSDLMDYIAEEATKNNKTDSVDITNKSTRAKKVKAVITMSNAKGLTFKSAIDGYETDEAATSVYFGATDGTTSYKLVAAEDGETASATYEVTVPAKTGGADVTYQTSATNAAGGHVYARYEGANPTYSTKAFYIEASANTDAKAKDAWAAWAKDLTAETRPSINIVYTVTNVLTPEEEEAAADEEATTVASAFTTKYATILAKTAETVTFEDLAAENGITAALAEYDELDAAVKAKLTEAKATLDALETAALAKQYTDEDAHGEWAGNQLWLAVDSNTGFASDTVTVEVKGATGDWAAFTSFTYSDNWVGIEWDDIEDAVGSDNASPYSVRVTDGTTRYTYSGT